MKTKFTILTTLFILISVQYLIAQPSVSFYFTTSIPVNDYQQFDDDLGYGGNLEIFFMSPSKQKPLGIGISFSYFGQGLYFYEDPCYCETYLSNNMANNFANAHFVFQLAPTGGTVRHDPVNGQGSAHQPLAQRLAQHVRSDTQAVLYSGEPQRHGSVDPSPGHASPSAPIGGPRPRRSRGTSSRRGGCA